MLIFLHDVGVSAEPDGALVTLGRRFELELPRHPGFAGRDDHRGEDWDGVEDLAQHHLATVGPRAPHLMGAGFGGWIALEMALRRPASFRTLTLICPYGVKLGGPLEQDFADLFLLDSDELLELGWAAPASALGVRLPGVPAGLGDDQLADVFAERAALARYGWKPFLHSPRLGRWLHAISTPTLVVSGERDRLIAQDHGERLASRLPRARHVRISGSGHYPYLETPEAFLAEVVPFLVSHATAEATE